ncbi:CynX/NimT family MFS transporter [Lentibacillus sediminis]|uniref:CynX/NimT family MFS transporter n=1 Tax=Lentibacillus sediminis TaxID=1940529 RepID=UPI001EFC3515|nr:MFS transporter [Lentibacillus sediminis]
MTEKQQAMPGKDGNRIYFFLLLAGIIVVAFNLRPAITSVGPLIGMIRDDLGLSNWSVGILTSLPLVAFAIMSPVAPRLANRWSNERALLMGLLLLFAGIVIRSQSAVALLFFGTLLIGFGIAISNVLLPGVVKEKFPDRTELMTGVYSTSMAIFAAAASGLSVPLASGAGLGWQLGLMVWGLPVIAGVLIWLVINRKNTGKEEKDVNYVTAGGNRMWRAPLAWQVALFMGFQSTLFYVTISWLPEILISYGVTMETAGWMLSVLQLIGLPFSFLMPVLAGKFHSQWGLVIGLGICGTAGYSCLLFAQVFPVMLISIVLLGVALGGMFPLCLTFLAMRARTAKQAAELSGMAQSLGYSLAAIGPVMIGYLYDITGTWSIPISVLIFISVLVVVFGSLSGRNRYVTDA